MRNLLSAHSNKTLKKAFIAGSLLAVFSSPLLAADGAAVYSSTCKNCHAAGLMGAPKFGDKAAWQDRIAKGMDTLYEHAIKGFTGAKGMMPAKGGKASLTDDEVKAGVDHMVNAAK